MTSDHSQERKPCLRAKLPDGRELVITPPAWVRAGELTSEYSASIVGTDGQASPPQAAKLHQIFDGALEFHLEDGSIARFVPRSPDLGARRTSFRATYDATPVEMTVHESEYDSIHVG